MRLLIVDDVAAMRSFLRLALSSLNGEIDEAADGVEALRLLTHTRYDLVFLDLNLPLLDGLKVLSKVRAESAHPSTPVIVVSTVTDPETLARATALGAIHVLAKPVDAFRLLDAAREVLRMAESPRADERRSTRRLRFAVTMTFSGDSELIEASTHDISATGAFIMTDRVKPLGMPGRAVFSVPHLNAPVEVEFNVVHIRTIRVGTLPPGMGIRFINVSPQTQMRVFELLASPA
jgi:two-component system chemotaxis response regulator CheY